MVGGIFWGAGEEKALALEVNIPMVLNRVNSTPGV